MRKTSSRLNDDMVTRFSTPSFSELTGQATSYASSSSPDGKTATGGSTIKEQTAQVPVGVEHQGRSAPLPIAR